MSIDALTAQFNMTSPVKGSTPQGKVKNPLTEELGGDDSFKQVLGQEIEPKNMQGGFSRSIPEITNQGAEERASEIEMAQLRSQQATLGEASRQAAMQDFLVKMQDQLNVEPEQIIQAFSELEPEDLLRAPEETVQLVIQNLNLPQEKVPVAEGLFEQMLVKTANGSMAETLKASGRDLSLDVHTKKELRQKQIHDSLDQMSRTFFVDSRGERNVIQDPLTPGPTQDVKRAIKAYGLQNAPADEKGRAFGAPLGMGAAVSAMSTEPKPTAEKPSVTAASGGDIDLSGFSEDAAIPFSSSEVEIPNLSENILTKSFSAPEEVEQEITDFDFQSIPDSRMEQDLNASVAPLSGAPANNGDSEHEGQNRGQGENHDATLVRTGETERVQAKEFIVPTTLAATQKQGTEVNGNVREIINQAQFMIKKGGGEMKMILQPEGLGEVHLKVAVQDGQVQINMVADTQEAKDLLQKGLVDLKATLASHKLNVDGIRVDVGQQASLDLNQNPNQDPAQRHFAQQFLNEFRQENEAWRRGFMDIGGARRISSQIEDSGSSSTIDPQTMAQSRARRRLDLVA